MYRGDTPFKVKTREMVWEQHRKLLGKEFLQVPHAFLASQFAGDVKHLLEMGVDPDNVWAVEKDHETVRALLPLRTELGFRLFGQNVQDFARKHSLKSLYLDFCGHLSGKGTRRAIKGSLASLDAGAIVSITLFRGREHDAIQDRGEQLLKLLRDCTKHPVSLVQEVLYMSGDTATKGSPMATWTFVLSKHTEPVIRYDLGSPPCRTLAAKRRNAALKAWRTRRAKAAC